MIDTDQLQTSFAEVGIAARHAAKQMEKLQRVIQVSTNKAAAALARSIFLGERSAVDRLADLVREDEDGG